MRVFVTGATGFIGTAIVRELQGAGHEVIGLARSDRGAEALAAAGAKVHRGSLEDVDSLRAGAAAADGVIHTAFVHDFSDILASARLDRQAIETLGEALAGSDRPLVITSGTASLAQGRLGKEDDPTDPDSPRGFRIPSEQAALRFAERGVRTSVLRLAPSVHGEGDHGFVPALIDVARDKGVSAYPGDGTNRWPAVHRLDAARLFRLALEAAPAGSRLHGVADQGVPVREIADLIGRHLGLPTVAVPVEEAVDHFGWIGGIFAMDVPASSAATQQLLGWRPVEPGLLADLDAGHYFG